VSPDTRNIRNLLTPMGRFFDEEDDAAHIKCAVVTEQFAHDRFGARRSGRVQTFEISRIPFTIIRRIQGGRYRLPGIQRSKIRQS